jgi:hypothetical protein
MKDRKPKCNCAKKGVMCALKLSLIKQEEPLSDAAVKNKAICPLKAALFSNPS